MNERPGNCMIQFQNQLSSVEMWYLKKRKVGTGSNKKFSNKNYVMNMQMIRQE